MTVQETASIVQSDALSAVLRELRFESAGYRWYEAGGQWRVGFDQPFLRGVHIVKRGTCDLVLDDGTTEALEVGDLVILPRGDAHELRSTGTGPGPVTDGFALAMRTPGNRLRVGGPTTDTVIVCGAFIVGDVDHPALRGLPRTIRVQAEAWLDPYLDAVDREATDYGPGSDLILARLSDALVTRALRHFGTTSSAPGWLAGLGDARVASALAAMHADPGRGWTVAALAATAGLSRAAFAARFTERIGEPVLSYLTTLRMHRAKALLRASDSTVAAVATQVGYGSDVAFAAAFRRAVGESPAAWRKRVPEKQPEV